MQTAKTLAFLLFLIAPFSAHARVLHYGDYSVELSAEKHTTPALHVQIGDELVFGAMFTDAAPENSLRISFNDINYWVGEWCAPGNYIPTGSTKCAPCGIGHYCSGGRHRAPCTGGAIACPGANHGADATTELANRLLTADQVNQYMPVTDISQWQLISCCATSVRDPYRVTMEKDTSQMFLPDVGGCAIKTFGPGTYMFMVNGTSVCQTVRPISISQYIAVIAQPSSFKQVHATNIFSIFVDTASTNFTSSAFNTPHYCNNDRNTNISNIDTINDIMNMCVYELK